MSQLVIRDHSGSYTLNNETIHFGLIYKKRKTMGIYIDVYGNLELRVPKDTPDSSITELLEKRWTWIHRNITEMKEKTKGFKEKVYEDGEEFLLLGRHYPIEIKEVSSSSEAGVALGHDVIVVSIKEKDEELIRKMLTRFYKQQCKKTVEARIRHYQPYFKTKPTSIKIMANKKHWGTCNSKRELTFNWRLVMAPLDVLDYVVLHEMCHMVHLNHDRSFWRLVGKYMPDYEDKQDWLSHSHWKMVV